jgi:membrane-associated phospholipid phosphatase
MSYLHLLGFAILLLGVFFGSILLRRYPDFLDWPIARLLNRLTRKCTAANRIAIGVAYPTLEGLILTSFIWYCWFADNTPVERARLVIGGGTAIMAGFVAHLVRYTVQAIPKPIFNPTLRLHPPDVLGDIEILKSQSFPDSPGFPSQRATMFAGLAVSIFLIRADLGSVALACTILVEFSRVYLGLHYPTDSIGSFSLGASLVLFSQNPWHSGLGLWFVKWESVSASTFYVCAFLVSYQIVTAFHEIRELLRRLNIV